MKRFLSKVGAPRAAKAPPVIPLPADAKQDLSAILTPNGLKALRGPLGAFVLKYFANPECLKKYNITLPKAQTK